MKVRKINIIGLKMFSVLLMSSTILYLYYFGHYFSEIMTYFFALFIAFSPFILYKELIKVFSSVIEINIENLLDNTLSLNNTIKIELSKIESYKISFPYSFVRNDDFIKFVIYYKDRKTVFNLVNKTIESSCISGISFLDVLKSAIKEFNKNSNKIITYKQSFFATKKGAIFIKYTIAIQIISLSIYYNIIHDIKQTAFLILLLLTSTISLIGMRQKEIELSKKYAN